MKKLSYLSVCVIILCITCCGYRFAGMEKNPFSDINTISVPLFTNNTNEPLIASLLTDALINELNLTDAVQIVSTDKSDAVLKGVVISVDTTTLAHSSIRTASEKRVRVTVSLRLVRVSDDKVLWHELSIDEWAEYFVSGSMDYSSERRIALNKAALKIAKKARDSMFTDF